MLISFQQCRHGCVAIRSILAWRIAGLMVVCLIMASSTAWAQFPPVGNPGIGETPASTQPSPYEQRLQANRAAAQAAYQQNLALAKENPHLLALPGILADRKARTVQIWAQATGIEHDKPVEFFLIPENSGKDYEALALAFAKPSDIHKALQFIGVKPGHPVLTASQLLWPKGERVFMTFSWQEEPAPANQQAAAKNQQVRVEQLVFDQRANQPLPSLGLVFTGSYLVDPPLDESGKPAPGAAPIYAADVSGSKSIASNYNEPSTVLDLPRQALQGEVYSTQFPNPVYRFSPGQPLMVLIEPEYKEGKLRVRDLILEARVTEAAGDHGQLKNVAFTLQDYPIVKVRLPLLADKTFVHVVASLAQLCESGHDPFVTLVLDDRMSLATCAQIAQMLRGMEKDQGIRMEPPPKGHLAHVAFLPPARWREVAGRPASRWELTLSRADSKLQGQLQMIEERWRLDAGPSMDKRQTSLADPAALLKTLKETERQFRIEVLFFAPADLTYGQLRAWTDPVLQANLTPVVFVGN